MDRSDLASRMKSFYEEVSKTRLLRRIPTVIRIDGRVFHTFTKGFVQPFDDVLIDSMHETMKYLCENIQGCVLGYTQSDEITLILTDYKELTSDAWFNYEVQKVCSIVASMATMTFNKAFAKNVKNFDLKTAYNGDTEENKRLSRIYNKAVEKGAMFDARFFNIPREEVTNLIYWRQLDASRNSVNMVGRAYFSHKELLNKSCSQIQDLLMTKGINWNNYPTYQKRGACCVKREVVSNKESDIPYPLKVMLPQTIVKTSKEWIVDDDIPIFKGNGRQYIEELI
jgi:tRNA(His) 5'-end guanylyltransferase